MLYLPEHFLSIFFVIGLLTVAAYAWQKFNEPSFPDRETLPHAVEPLRYLFLRPAYQKARFTYVAALLFLYGVLVWPGPKLVPYLSMAGGERFPAEGWALLVAVVVVGLLPNSNVKILVILEETLRRWVHGWFLVPDGVERTVGVLEDARYQPPLNQLNAVQNPLREKLQTDLKLPTSSLRYRWARASMLMESLRQMGAGAAHPLHRAAFEPFQKDFEAIRVKYKALGQDIAALGDTTDAEREDALTGSVDNLLKRIYAYISWGIRHQADSERAVDDTLQELGFRIPPIGRRRLFDIVAPMVIFVALITMAFWLIVDAVNRALHVPRTPELSDSIVFALTSATAASLMYGRAVYIALNRRAVQIEQKVWRQGSSRCLVPIAIAAGIVTWAVIILTTVIWDLQDTLESLAALVQLDTSRTLTDALGQPGAPAWRAFPIRVATALPWLLAGAVASALVASLLGRDLRRASRLHDVIALATCLAAAVAMAQVMQTALANVMGAKASPFSLVPIVGLAGFACGAVIGFVVPRACRARIVTPSDPTMARALRDLLRRAEAALGSRAAAENWVFTPCDELDGITPAEAIQYKGLATGVKTFLGSDAPNESQVTQFDRGDWPMPVVIDGGRSAG